MDRLLAMLLALIVGIGAMAGLDRYPHMGLHLPFWPHWGVDVPDSLSVQRDKALADGVKWKAAYYTEAAALTAQEKAQQAVVAAGAVKLAQSAPLPSEARANAAVALSKRNAISAAGSGPGQECERALRVDQAFTEALK